MFTKEQFQDPHFYIDFAVDNNPDAVRTRLKAAGYPVNAWNQTDLKTALYKIYKDKGTVARFISVPYNNNVENYTGHLFADGSRIEWDSIGTTVLQGLAGGLAGGVVGIFGGLLGIDNEGNDDEPDSGEPLGSQDYSPEPKFVGLSPYTESGVPKTAYYLFYKQVPAPAFYGVIIGVIGGIIWALSKAFSSKKGGK